MKQRVGKIDFDKVRLERDLGTRCNVSLAFRTLANAVPRESAVQASMFAGALAPPEVPAEPTCTHVGTGRDYQRELDGRESVLCGKCGGSTVILTIDGEEGYAVEVAIREDGRYAVVLCDESGETLLGSICRDREKAVAEAQRIARTTSA